MSYEILLYPRRPGQSWDEVIAEDEQDGPGLDQTSLNRGVARFRRIEARLREQLTEPVRTWVAEETDGDVLGEFDATESGLRVELYDRAAQVSFPWSGPEAPVTDLARTAIEIVAEETGFEPYDAEVGREFTGDFDDAAGRAAMERAAREAEENPEPETLTDGDTDGTDPATPVDPRQQAAEDMQRRLQEQDPAKLRRRSRLYVILGVVLVAYGVWRIMEGDSGFLTWLILGIGAFDLLGGWMMSAMATQVEAARRQQGTVDGGGTTTADRGDGAAD